MLDLDLRVPETTHKTC